MRKSSIYIGILLWREHIREPRIDKSDKVLANLVVIVVAHVWVQGQVYVVIYLTFDLISFEIVLIKIFCQHWHVNLEFTYDLICLLLCLTCQICFLRIFPGQIFLAAIVKLDLHKFCCLRGVASFQSEVEFVRRAHVNASDSNCSRRLSHILESVRLADRHVLPSDIPIVVASKSFN